MSIKIGMISLGCPKNQTDAEIMLSLLQKGGYEITADEKQAEVIIVNTCGFIADAKKEAIENILDAAALKKTGKLRALIVTGCLAQRYRDQILSELPEVDAVVGIGSNKHICSIVKAAVSGCPYSAFGDNSELLLDGERKLCNPAYSAYLRIADGCDNRCSYCAIPLIRGGYRSRSMESVLDEAKSLAAQGTRELILIAQDTTRYGEDNYKKQMLPELLTELCKIDGIEWIRILYAYPDRITDRLLDVIAENPKLLHYLDIPLQHASGDVLRRMNRRGDYDSLCALIKKIRQRIPDIVLRTTLMVGFPGETEQDFEQLCRFVKEMRFNRMGCFIFSAEEDTPAAEMDGQIDPSVSTRRMDILMSEQAVISDEMSREQLGKTLEVLVEGYDRLNRCWYGRSRADAPDIDGKVFFMSEREHFSGELVQISIFDKIDYDLLGDEVEKE